MKILWSEFAIEMLLEIYSYYKGKASPAGNSQLPFKASGQKNPGSRLDQIP